MGRHWGTPWDRGCALAPRGFRSAPWAWRPCTGCQGGLLPGLESPPNDPVLRVQEGSELSSGPQGGVPQPLLASRSGTLPSWEGEDRTGWGGNSPSRHEAQTQHSVGTGAVSGRASWREPLSPPHPRICDLGPQRARKAGVLPSPAGPPVRAGGGVRPGRSTPHGAALRAPEVLP